MGDQEPNSLVEKNRQQIKKRESKNKGKHDHTPKCLHENLTYCPDCDLVHCKDCKREWGDLNVALKDFFNNPSKPRSRILVENEPPHIPLILPATKPHHGQFVCHHS